MWVFTLQVRFPTLNLNGHKSSAPAPHVRRASAHMASVLQPVFQVVANEAR